MKFVALIIILCVLKVGAQMDPLVQQESIEQQNVSPQTQALQAPAVPNQPESPPANPLDARPLQEPPRNEQSAGDLKAPQGPINVGPYTQQSIGTNNSKELEQRISGRMKDPFMLPNHLYMKIKRKLGDIQGEGYIDESVEPQRRWALKRYKLVAIIWNVKRPKAMIIDAKAELHMFYLNDRIGNSEGVISGISNGEVTVNEKGTESKLKMLK